LITRVDINGFMSYDKASLDLADGVNLVAGENRSGKTNLLRAIKWVLLNVGPPYNDDPELDRLRHGVGEAKAGEAVVRVTFGDGGWVERRRSKGENAYILHFPDGREERHDGPGTGFYEPVSLVTRFFPVDVGGTETLIGWQGVHDAHMLVTDTPTQLDKRITRLVGSNTIEDAVSIGEASYRKLSQEAARLRAEAEEKEAEAEGYEGIDDALDAAMAARDAESKLKDAASSLTQAKTVVEGFGKARVLLTSLGASVADAMSKLSKARESVANALGFYETIRKADDLANQYIAQRVLADRGGSVIDSAVSTLREASVARDALKDVSDNLNAVTRVASAYTQAKELLVTETTNLDAVEQKVSSVKSKRKHLMDELDICPHCGRPAICPHCGHKL